MPNDFFTAPQIRDCAKCGHVTFNAIMKNHYQDDSRTPVPGFYDVKDYGTCPVAETAKGRNDPRWQECPVFREYLNG
jgi:hypothetical protein